jgi:hypothetical protein
MTRPQLARADLRYLKGPIVQARSGGWEVPERLRLVIAGARLNLITSGEKELATEEEALAYLCVASLEAPLSSDWAHIFLYLAQEVLPRWHFTRTDEPIWQALGYDSPLTLNSNQRDDLRDLRRKIRRAVVKNSKQ